MIKMKKKEEESLKERKNKYLSIILKKFKLIESISIIILIFLDIK